MHQPRKDPRDSADETGSALLPFARRMRHGHCITCLEQKQTHEKEGNHHDTTKMSAQVQYIGFSLAVHPLLDERRACGAVADQLSEATGVAAEKPAAAMVCSDNGSINRTESIPS